MKRRIIAALIMLVLFGIGLVIFGPSNDAPAENYYVPPAP